MYHFWSGILGFRSDAVTAIRAEGWVDLQFSVEDGRFRDEARAWLHDNVPRERRPHAGEAMRAFDTAWQLRQFEGGWAGVSWPKEYGGLGLPLIRQLILAEEFARAGLRRNETLLVGVNASRPIVH